MAFAVGAALPSSRIGYMDVVDQQGATWASNGKARINAQSHVHIADQGSNSSANTTGRPCVAVYVDLLPQRSDSAFTRYIEDHGPFLAAWCHLTSTGDTLLDPADAGLIAAEVAAHIRALSNNNSNAEVQLLLRCPFPLALLIGRLTNTLRVVVHEWDDSDPVEGEDYRARYVPTLRVRASASSGVIEDVLLPDAS